MNSVINQIEAALDRDRAAYIATIGEGDVRAQKRTGDKFRRSLMKWQAEKDKARTVEAFRISVTPNA